MDWKWQSKPQIHSWRTLPLESSTLPSCHYQLQENSLFLHQTPASVSQKRAHQDQSYPAYTDCSQSYPAYTDCSLSHPAWKTESAIPCIYRHHTYQSYTHTHTHIKSFLVHWHRTAATNGMSSLPSRVSGSWKDWRSMHWTILWMLLHDWSHRCFTLWVCRPAKTWAILQNGSRRFILCCFMLRDGAVVGRWTRNWQVVGSIHSQSAFT